MKFCNHQGTSFLIFATFLAATPSVVSSFLTHGGERSRNSSNQLVVSQRYSRPVAISRIQTTRSFDSVLKWRGGATSNKKNLNPFSSTARDASLEQFAGPASSLFGNMITPASILCGAIIPLCFASGLDFDGPVGESKFRKVLRKVFPFVSTASLASLLIAIMCSSVAVNQLTENKPALAASVWDLLQRDYALAWAAVNSHFVLGMLGFMWLIGTKALFMGGGPAAFGLALSGMTAMVSIVNRGVASGGGAVGQRFGASILGLFQSYASLLWTHSCQTLGPLEYIAVGIFLCSIFGYSRFVWKQIQT